MMAEPLRRYHATVLRVTSNPTVRILLGAFWTCMAILTAVLAIIVFGQQQREDERGQREATQHHKEAATAHVICERSRIYGPELANFFSDTEAKLAIDAISLEELRQYRETIPKHCPKLESEQSG